MKFLDSVWAFLSVVIIAWITQRIGSYWDRRKRVADTKLSIYMSWLPFLAEVYASTRFPDSPDIETREFFKKKMEILGILQLMGPDALWMHSSRFVTMPRKRFERTPHSMRTCFIADSPR
jgi:hypothetical protein